MKSRWLRRRGHSMGVGFLEIMLAVALVAILGAVAFPSYGKYRKRVDTQTATADIRNLEAALAQFAAQSPQGTLPASLDELGVATVSDPWGNPYQYLNMDGANRGQMRKDRSLVPINSDYDLYSMGPDGRSVGPLTAAMSRDDIVRAGNGSFIGTASDYVP